MRKEKLDNKTLDAIGQKLIESIAPRSCEIEDVISNPRLYARVAAKIRENGWTPSSGASSEGLPFVRRYALALAGIAVVFIAAVFGVAGLLKSGQTQPAARKAQVPDVLPEIAARPVAPPKPVESATLPGRAPDRPYHVEKAVVRSAPRKINRNHPLQTEPEAPAAFVPLSTTDDSANVAGSDRIVRVELSKSSLFALGLNVPLENGPNTMKADLLIGADGSTRGIRVLN